MPNLPLASANTIKDPVFFDKGAFSKKVVETLNNKIEAYKTGSSARLTNFKG